MARGTFKANPCSNHEYCTHQERNVELCLYKRRRDKTMLAHRIFIVRVFGFGLSEFVQEMITFHHPDHARITNVIRSNLVIYFVPELVDMIMSYCNVNIAGSSVWLDQIPDHYIVSCTVALSFLNCDCRFIK